MKRTKEHRWRLRRLQNCFYLKQTFRNKRRETSNWTRLTTTRRGGLTNTDGGKQTRLGEVCSCSCAYTACGRGCEERDAGHARGAREAKDSRRGDARGDCEEEEEKRGEQVCRSAGGVVLRNRWETVRGERREL